MWSCWRLVSSSASLWKSFLADRLGSFKVCKWESLASYALGRGINTNSCMLISPSVSQSNIATKKKKNISISDTWNGNWIIDYVVFLGFLWTKPSLHHHHNTGSCLRWSLWPWLLLCQPAADVITDGETLGHKCILLTCWGGLRCRAEQSR